MNLEAYCGQHGVTKAGKAYIEAVRNSPPSRRVQSDGTNVTARYPSQKMSVALEAESHSLELSLLYQLEHSDEVLEFYTQALPIKLSYVAASGRMTHPMYTPDFLVLDINRGVHWIECKPESVLEKLAEKMPNRYVRDCAGTWICPPVNEVARQFGFTYRFFTSSHVNEVLVRNLQYLEDYKRGRPLHVPDDALQVILKIVQTEPGIRLCDLRAKCEQFPADYFNSLISDHQLFVNLITEPLANPTQVRVYADQATASAYAPLQTDPPAAPDPSPILSRSTPSVLNEANGDAEGRTGAVSGADAASPSDNHPPELLEGFSSEDLEEANRRLRVIEQPELAAVEMIPERTVRRWKKMYVEAEAAFGWGYLGLLPKVKDRGNRTPKLPEMIGTLADKIVAEHYMNTTKKRKKVAYSFFVTACTDSGFFIPSYQWFCKHINRHTAEELARARDGKRAAYKYQILNRTRPNFNNGAWPMHVAHVDHTLADLEVVDEETGENLGRPWLSLMVDSFSREVLAYDLSFDPPSAATCMVLIRDCVQRNRRLPLVVVTDNGKEFHSAYFETLMSRYECTLKRRPPAKPRFGSIIERLFGTVNMEFFHTLQGNTQTTKNPRQTTKSIAPKTRAVWHLPALQEKFEEYAFKVYPQTMHTGIGSTPAETRARGIATHGARVGREILLNEDFTVLTMPAIPRGRATVQPSRGIKVHTAYYWNDAMRSTEVEKSAVPVRFDPFDLGHVYAFIKKKWVRCITNETKFHGHSMHEIRAVSQVLRRRDTIAIRKRATVSSRDIANYLSSNNVDEKVLEQRRKDNAARHKRGAFRPPTVPPPVTANGSVLVLKPKTVLADL